MEKLRYTNPSFQDVAPFGFVVKVMHEGDTHTRWIQLNSNPEINPTWIPINQFLEDSLSKYFDNEEFVNLMINVNKNKDVNSIKALGKLLQTLTY